MYKSEMNLNYPVQHFIVHLENNHTIEEFIKKDHDVWTMALKDYPEFISKSIWVNDEVLGEIHFMITWRTLDTYHTKFKDDKKKLDEKFRSIYPYNFNISNEIEGIELYEYCFYENSKGFNE